MREPRIPLEELVSLPSFVLVTPSWARDKVGFYWDRTGRFELYVLDLTSREVRQITDGEAPRQLRAGFTWTRDDAAIIFGKDKDGDERNNLFHVNVATSSVTQLTNKPDTQEYAVEVSPDNRRLSVMSNEKGQMNLYTLDLHTKEWVQLTDFDRPVSGGQWSPDGQRLAFSSNESANLQNQDVYLVNADGSSVEKILSVEEGSKEGIADWHPDGRLLAVSSDATGAFRPGILELASGEVAWLGQDGVEEYAVEFSQDGSWLLTVRNQDATLIPVLYPVGGDQSRTLQLPPGLVQQASFILDDRKLLVVHSSANRRAELLLYDLESDQYETLLPAEYGSIDPALFVNDEYVHYPSSDGQMVPAILYKPRDITADEKLPGLVIVHGGPTAQFFRGFDPYAQFLADHGIVVLQPNIRGSTGYGNAWRDANIRDWGGGDLEDVAAGAEFLKSLPFVDPERIGVFGGSFGGYMSFMAVVKKPDLFKVGVPWVGITDLHLLYEEDMEHFRYYFRQQMGDPDEQHDLWRDRSPITHADKLQSKLLIIHGVNDPRCPITQARIFRERLLELGKREGVGPEDDFEYHEFDDEGHGPGGDIQGKLRSYRLLSDFLARRL